MKNPVPYNFARKSAHRQSDSSPLRRISDRYAVAMASAIEHIAGHRTEVTVEEIIFSDFSKWSGVLAPLSSLSIFRLLPLRGSIILHLEETMINSLINVYFGGAPAICVKRTKDGFRQTETQLIDRLALSLMERLADVFSGYGPIKPVFQRHETSASYLTGYKPEDQLLCQPFRISMGTDISWRAELVYSPDAAESAMEFIQSQIRDLPAESDPEWERQWSRNLKQIYLPLRTIVAQPTMRLPELFNMKPGDVIPITPRAKPPLFIGNRKFATGTLGEKNGCAAFRIEHIEQGDT
ncbi:FliM/FliN family flagellar motor switch protein [Parasphingorhabdus sp.]|uniref:FliM/FliN family flagellar motor switch protein n=1 Tax=Parasphingorhabdus sp. TaxID=2709688 RepID=UPI002F924C41